MRELKQSPEEYLKQPYLRILIPDRETGTFTAEIMEFPGCVAQGDTPQEAYERLEKVALSWIETAVDAGQDVPMPVSTSEYGGKVALRLPKSLHKQAVLAAQRDGTSLNQFIVMALAERIGTCRLYDFLAEKLDWRVSQMTRPAASFAHTKNATADAAVVGSVKRARSKESSEVTSTAR